MILTILALVAFLVGAVYAYVVREIPLAFVALGLALFTAKALF